MPRLVDFQHGIAAESLEMVVQKTLERLPKHVFRQLVNAGGTAQGLEAHFSTGYDGKYFFIEFGFCLFTEKTLLCSKFL